MNGRYQHHLARGCSSSKRRGGIIMKKRNCGLCNELAGPQAAWPCGRRIRANDLRPMAICKKVAIEENEERNM